MLKPFLEKHEELQAIGESTRSVNDVGISSFSKVAAMVEAHNWIPEHKPLKKDTIDEMIDYLSTITKSL